MKARVLVAVVGIPALIYLLGIAPVGATMLVTAAMCAVGAYELMHALMLDQEKSILRLTVATAALAPVCINLAYDFGQLRQWANNVYEGPVAYDPTNLLYALALVFLFCLFLVAILNYGKEDGRIPFAAITAALFGGLAFPLMLSCLLRLRLMEHGELLVFLPLAISFGSDTFAFFGGLLFGKHKLTPVSPKKTKEGAVGGLIGGVIGMMLVKWTGLLLLDLSLFGWGQVVFMGLAGSAVSQIGDLSFSVIKREFGVKDYGKLLPGHGGILDRFDSVTFVAPFVWMLMLIVM